MKSPPTKPQAITNINEAKESANNEITTNKTASVKGLLALLLIIQTNKGSKTLHFKLPQPKERGFG
ncbi:hypothetical protein HpHA286_19540 [Helicobacter pylori]